MGNDRGHHPRGTPVLGLAVAILLAAGAMVSTLATGADNNAGTIRVGEQSWTLVPSIQCGVYPGPMVAIAGHAAGKPDIEITIDYDPSSDFVEAKVTGGDEEMNLSARDDDLSVDVNGKTVTGTGSFRSGWGAGPVTEGSFRIDC